MTDNVRQVDFTGSSFVKSAGENGGFAFGGGGGDNGDMENRVERLEHDMAEVKATLTRMEPVIARIDERLNSSLPTLATKADLAEKPSRTYLWSVVGVLTACIFAAVLLGASLISIV
jgi:anti-sigma-K factor RskA